MKVVIIHPDERWCNGRLILDEVIRQGKSIVSTRLNEELERWKFLANGRDWVLVTGMLKLRPRELYELRKITKVAVWDADALNTHRKNQWMARKDCIDLVITSVMENKFQFDGIFPHIEWIPQSYDAYSMCPTVGRLQDPKDVAFVGNTPGDTNRPKWIAELRKEFSMNLAGWIKDQDDSHYRYGPMMADIYANSRVAIDIKRSHPFDYGMLTVSDRIYKAMGCGAMFIIYPVPGLELMFKNGEHLVVYNGELDDLKEKIRYYLDHSEEREKIAKNGQREIMKNHTLEKRVGQYWELLEAYK